MNPRNIPFRRWPLYHHVLLASALVAVVFVLGWWWLLQTQTSFANGLRYLHTIRVDRGAAPGNKPGNVRRGLTHVLPSALHSEDVVRDITKFGQSLGVRIVSLAVAPQAASASEVGKVQFILVAVAEYQAAKAWLAELLARYPTLGIQTLAMRPQSNNPLAQDIQLSLTLFVKD